MTNIKHKIIRVVAVLSLLIVMVAPTATTFAGTQCGDGVDKVKTSINIGCKGKGNPIADMMFAIIRFLSTGVGIVIVGSTILAGIQYSAAGGNPQAVAKARGRITSNVVALLIFIFGYALLNYITPGGFLNG